MGVFEQFPYSNFHELNFDWILTELKKALTEWSETRSDFDGWKEYIISYFDNLNLTEEVRGNLVTLINNGVLDSTVSGFISSWLRDHITDTAPPIDDSLTVSGAAADAAAVGEQVRNNLKIAPREIADWETAPAWTGGSFANSAEDAPGFSAYSGMTFGTRSGARRVDMAYSVDNIFLKMPQSQRYKYWESPRWKYNLLYNRYSNNDDFPTVNEVIALWDTLINNNSYYTRETLTTVEGLPLVCYHLDYTPRYITSGYTISTPAKLYNKPKILITACVHGIERAPATALFAAVQEMVLNPYYSDLLGAFEWYFIPVANPWGFSHTILTSGGSYTGAPRWDNNGNLLNGMRSVLNTADLHFGVRQNKDGYDINRDYSDNVYSYTANDITRDYGFKTAEARAIRDLMTREKFDYVIDLHQSSEGAASSTGAAAGFISMNSNPPRMSADSYNELKHNVYQHLDAVNRITDSEMCRHYKKIMGLTQYSFIWDGSNLATFRNYAAGWNNGTRGNINHVDAACKYALCMETSYSCTPFSNTSTPLTQSVHDYTMNYILNLLVEFKRDFK